MGWGIPRQNCTNTKKVRRELERCTPTIQRCSNWIMARGRCMLVEACKHRHLSNTPTSRP